MKVLVAILCLLLIFQIIRAQSQKQKRLKFQLGHIKDVSEQAISEAITKLSQLDVNAAKAGDISVDYQNMASHTHFGHDNAPNPFFTTVSSSLLQKSTYVALSNLLAAYTSSDVDTQDNIPSQLVTSFLTSVSNTAVYQTMVKFLQMQSLITGDATPTLMDLWFTPYAINTVKGTSGFKQVFAGVSQGSQVLGLNNWVRYYTLEQQQLVNYHGWFARQEISTISMQFSWGNLEALMQNFTVGTSPEFDFCAYTICALSSSANPKICTYQNQLAGYNITLEVETINDNGVTRIKHASPYVGKISDGNVTPSPPSGNFQKLVDAMRAADVDRAQSGDIVLDWGSHLSANGEKKGKASGQLFTYVNEQLFTRPVYKKLIDIYNASFFYAQVCDAEVPLTGFKKSFLDDYLRTLTNTTVFQLAYNYLVAQGAASSNWDTFYTNLFDLWYGTYSRCSGTQGSSGYEHVYLGEWKGNEVDGQHNWVRYYLEQKAGLIDYKGYYSHEGDLIGTWEYSWNGYSKPKGGFFIGTSPAFDLAIFTTCVLTQQGSSKCAFTMDGQYNVYITSYDQSCDMGTCLSTSYPSDEA